MSEMFAARFKGGPMNGITVGVEQADPIYGWPLPEQLKLTPDGLRGADGEEAQYVKTNQSLIEHEIPGILRGAEYRWLK